jgi:hypothetical protein
VEKAVIKEILDAEQRRWTEFWWNRLHRFGMSFSHLGS